MLRTRRQPGDRRWGLHVEFPLRDSAGVLVVADRRRAGERRKQELTMEALSSLLGRGGRERD